MKCKYMINDDVVCICDCKERNTENNEQECQETRQLNFNFEKFWKENFKSERSIDFELSFVVGKFHIDFYTCDSKNLHKCFVSESLIEVCEMSLKYKEENEKNKS